MARYDVALRRWRGSYGGRGQCDLSEAAVRVGARWYSLGQPWRGDRWPAPILARAVAAALLALGLVQLHRTPSGSGPPPDGGTVAPWPGAAVVPVEVGAAELEAAVEAEEERREVRPARRAAV